MIQKSGRRFSEKIMLKQPAKAKYQVNLKSFRFNGRYRVPAGNRKRAGSPYWPLRRERSPGGRAAAAPDRWRLDRLQPWPRRKCPAVAAAWVSVHEVALARGGPR